jgi:DNA polymerase-3 subunit epsilon
MKIVYIDLETTGLDWKMHGIHQIAGYVEVDYKLVDTFNFKVQPKKGCMISKDALEIGRVTIDQLRTYPMMDEVHKQFTAVLAKHVNKFNKKDKAFFCGYNAYFDNGFMRNFFQDNKDSFFGSWFHSGTLDVMGLALNKLKFERDTMENFKLMTVAKKLGLNVDEAETHDAMYDIRLTREMYHIIEGRQIGW